MKSTYIVLPVVIALSLVYFPSFWVNLCLVIDFYTSWELFNSSIYNSYHAFVVSRLPDRPMLQMQEIHYSEVTNEKIHELTKNFTWPLVIRGFLGNTTAVKNWGNLEWWMERYPNEEVLCSQKGPYLAKQVDNCTFSRFFEQLKTEDPFYIVGATTIFENHPELHDMVNNDNIDQIEPGKRIATQMFMGLPGQGTDIHCAAGVNIFRQVAGSKKWWFVPPTQTKYLKPSLNANGFSAFSHTLVGKDGKIESPWLKKLERYTTTVHPGDVLINPPWFWHGTYNLGNASDVIVGCPSRYGRGNVLSAAFKVNFLMTAVGIGSLVKKYGVGVLNPVSEFKLQKYIAANRDIRTKEGDQLLTKEMEGAHPFDVEAALND